MIVEVAMVDRPDCPVCQGDGGESEDEICPDCMGLGIDPSACDWCGEMGEAHNHDGVFLCGNCLLEDEESHDE